MSEKGPPSPTPTLEQLKKLSGFLANGRDNSGKTLNGRKVMIPITTKGFFEGSLNPSVRKLEPSQSQTSSASNLGKEQVIAKIGEGYMAEMTTDEACKYIERRMESIRSLAKGGTPTTVLSKESSKLMRGKKNKLKMKKGFLQSQNQNSKKSSSAPAAPSNVSTEERPSSRQQQYPGKNQTKKTAVEPSLPFMEIREEYDDDGNEIKAEALDVSKELLNLHRTIQSKKKESVGSEANILETLAESVPKNLTSDDDENDNGEGSIENLTSLKIPENGAESDDMQPKPKPRPYEEISARLDELIFLEEKEEKKKTENAKSSKALQGSGWKKGFLSNHRDARGKKEKKKASAPENTDTISETATETPAKSNAKSSEKRLGGQSGKSVQFGENKIKEIPRIGTRSIQDVTAPRKLTHTKPCSVIRNQTNESRMIQESSTSLGQTLLAPNIDKREARKSVNKPVSLGGIVERPGVGNAFTISSDGITNMSEQQPKKKMSRFAQRRQQQR